MSRSEDKTVELIKLVRLRRELWDIQNSRYGDRKLRKDSWAKIGRQLNVTPEMAQHKFKCLRTYAKFEKKKLESKTRNTDGSLPESNWYAFKHMQFILGADSTTKGDICHKGSTRKRKIEDAQLEIAYGILKDESKRKNNFSSFGEHVAYKLSTYNKRLQSKVEFEIAKILHDADMEIPSIDDIEINSLPSVSSVNNF